MSEKEESMSSASMAEEVAVSRQQRTTYRTSATKEANKIRDYKEITDANIESAMVSVAKLNRLRAKLEEIDKFLLVHGGFSDIEAEIEKCEGYQDTLLATVEILTNRIRIHQAMAGAATTSSPQLVATPERKPKLQDLKLTTFDGDPLYFDEFWDDFRSTVDLRNDYSTTDKFKYLKQALRGEALAAIDGYLLTEANYEHVKAELKERYGDSEVAIFAHFQALLEIQPASHELKQLSKVRDRCETHIRSLIALGLDEDTFGLVFCPILLSKLPKFVRLELHRKNGSNKWKLPRLRELLWEEVKNRERCERFSVDANSGHKDENRQRNGAAKPRKQGTGSTLLAGGSKDKGKKGEKKYKCVLCDGDHFTDECNVYPKVQDRVKRVVDQRRCFVCLSREHMKSSCPHAKTQTCFHCKKWGHHRSLCYSLPGMERRHESVNIGNAVNRSTDLVSATTVAAKAAIPVSSTSTQRADAPVLNPDSKEFVPMSNTYVASSSNRRGVSRKGQAVMETCVAPLKGTKCAKKVRIVFDTASTRSFIRKAVAREVGAKFMGHEETSIGRLGEAHREQATYGICSADVILPNGTLKMLLLTEIESISTPIRLVPLNEGDLPQMVDVYMAEGMVMQPCDVQLDMLIGLDYYYEFVGPTVAQLQSGLVLKSTIIGHIVTGFQTERWSSQTCGSAMLITEKRKTIEDEQVERMWTLEGIGIKDDPVTTDDDKALEFFNKTIKFVKGRFEVKWLYREGMVPESDNRGLAEGRLRSLYRRLHMQPEVLLKYDGTISDQLQKGIVEIAPSVPDGPEHYIPHHHVIKETSATTKLRIVYDASAKTKRSHHSLNECLYRGPVILADLGGMLMRHRLSAIAMTADIEKAFLQIGLQKEDRDVTRFLWLKNHDKPPTPDNVVVLRFTRVPFGFVTSQFLLDGTIAHHLRQRGSALALEVLNNLFVDNVQGGRETVGEAVEFYKEVKKLFTDASLNLREWFSNSKEFVNHVADCDRGEGAVTRFLGLQWDTGKDELSVTVGRGATNQVQTKRSVLQGIASAFDPCGWFSPTLTLGKILMQEIWKRDLAWDSKLPDDLQGRWQAVQADILRLPEAKFSRYIGAKVFEKTSTLSLHCFCDASGAAYGLVVYLVASDGEKVTSTLLFAKSRVCPLREISIPRLELMAATLGSKIVRYVRKELMVPVSATYLWTDSKCVLCWILNESVKERFVENRLKEIRGPDIQFRYVPTSENPADIASRGASYDKLMDSTLWWEGPAWIKEPSESWPTSKVEPNSTSHNADNFQTSAISAVANENRTSVRTAEPEKEFVELTNFSTLTKLLRVTAYVMRFLKKFKKEPVPEFLTSDELSEAANFWVKRVQESEFGDFDDKRQQKPLYRQLGVYRAENGVLRCRGRFANADIPVRAQDPILLPRFGHFTRLVIEDAHHKVLHSGLKHTLAQVRQQYWVIHGRSQVKAILVQHCKKCKRYQGFPFNAPPPPPLPDFRVSRQRPFSRVGIDYIGPVQLKEGEDTIKAWISLFTCAAVRGIHLELVTSLSTQHFLLALRRFCALYGVPELIVSDNASHFKSTDKVIRKLSKSSTVQDFSAQALIKWKFTTELAPWMGGFYERMVAPVKQALRKCIGQRLLNAVELQTVLYEIAAVVNSRPLAVNEGGEVGENPLTPNHFLLRTKWVFPRASENLKVIAGTQRATDLMQSWNRLRNVLAAFWSQWQRDYLVSLREQFWPKNNTRVTFVLPREGQTVLVSEKGLPRGRWRMARIVKLVPSADGQVRTAEIMFANKRISRRAIKLLYPLETSEEPTVLPRAQRQYRRDLTPRPPDDDEEYDVELLAVSDRP